MINEILEILDKTRDNQFFSNPTSSQVKILEYVGSRSNEEKEWIADRHIRIRLGIYTIESGASVEEVVEKLTWKDFEGFIAEILQENNYRCVESFRRRGKSEQRGMEIDVIGLKGNIFLVVDAKMWNIRRGKKSALQNAALKQFERTERLCSEMGALSSKMGAIGHGMYTLIPLLVTWVVEDVEFHEGIPVVPIFKFNSFVLNFTSFIDMVRHIECRI